jgi:Skp family chaperone for outer membrane proteins
VKRFVLIAAAVSAVSAAFVVSRLAAQQGAAPVQAPATTRVALINIAKVFQDYEKAKFLKDEMRNMAEPKRLLREKLAKEIIAWKQAMTDPKFPQDQKDRYERGIVNNQRQIEDIDREMRQMLGEKNEQQYVQLYKDVSDAVQRYAQANNFHVVLAYIEPTQGDLFSIANILRKVQGMDMGGTVTGMFMAPGVDISSAVVDLMNQNYRAAAGSPGLTPTTFPPGKMR